MPREKQFEANVEIEGVTSMLIQKYPIQEEAQVTSPNTDYSEEWKKCVHLDNGWVVLPSINVEMSIREAAKGQKIGKNFLTKIVPTGLQVNYLNDIPILDENGKKFTIEDIEERDWLYTCPVVIQNKRVMKTRVRIPQGWKMQFTVEVESPLLTSKIVAGLIEKAGYCSGLGVWRPSSKSPGKHGQFDLTKFEVIE